MLSLSEFLKLSIRVKQRFKQNLGNIILNTEATANLTS